MPVKLSAAPVGPSSAVLKAKAAANAAAQKAPVAPPEPVDTTVYNKGTRSFYVGSGKVSTGPNKVTASEAASLLKLYPREIISTADGPSTTVAALEAEVVALRAQLAAIKKDVAPVVAPAAPSAS
jgi:hypothetical protein